MRGEPTYSFIPADQVRRKAKHRPHPAELLTLKRGHRVEALLKDAAGRSEPVWIRVAEIIDFRLMGCHRSFVYKLIAQGDLPQPIKLGRSARFKASEFNEAVRAMHS